MESEHTPVETKPRHRRPPRWFGTLRKSDGTLIMTTQSTLNAADQASFLRQGLHMERGDTILDLFLSDSLEPAAYLEYCEDTFKATPKKPGPVTPTV